MDKFSESEDWVMDKRTLGEGAYGEVKLLINRSTNEKVACKIIHYSFGENNATSDGILKEVLIHKRLSHPNIIQYYGRKQFTDMEFIYLEFAARGELFQLIEPDEGLASHLVQIYMKQLLNGVEYLHKKGVVHRDIKPENLLIDDVGNLKISDFGLATVYRNNGRERTLQKSCGTKPYCAPEVLNPPYNGPPADIWSCGIVLVAMLSGELPWNTVASIEFEMYTKDDYLTLSPWTKLGNATLNLIKKILAVVPENRPTIPQLRHHPWMFFQFNDGNEKPHPDGIIVKNLNVEMETRLARDAIPNVTLSQPVTVITMPSYVAIGGGVGHHQHELESFSQPTQNDHLILSTQIPFTQTPITKYNFNLIKRMTRFFVSTAYDKTLEMLQTYFQTYHYMWHLDGIGTITVTTVDEIRNPLAYKVHLLQMDGRILVDSRLVKGCGLAFKKKFLRMRKHFADVIEN